MTVFEAYITNLGKYAEGQLVGETLKFPATTEEVQSLLKNIGVDGVRYEEFFITAFDGDVMGLYDYLTEYENLDELNHLAHLISELDSDEIETLEAALNKLLWDKMSQSRVWGGSPTSVFAARRDAKIASVATLALLAVSASPGNPTENGGSAVSYTPSVSLAFCIPSAVASMIVNSFSSIVFSILSMCWRQSLSSFCLSG